MRGRERPIIQQSTIEPCSPISRASSYPINQSLVEWLSSKSDAELEALDIAREAVGAREF